MFRRKEESATDFTNDAAVAVPTHAANGAAPVQESAAATAAPVSAPVAPAYTAPATHSYAPASATAQPAPRAAAPAAAEPASRPVASAAPSYRPTPIAEFSRSAARPSEASRPAATQASAASTSSFSSASEKSSSIKPNRRVLTVGNDILLKGEIATCDRLVIEGRVEAKLSDVHTVEIAECGSFKGTAEVEDAEISGVFEGDLVVRNRLVIYATGEVRGNIGYGEIEIERGGKLTGQIKTVAAAPAGKVKNLDVTTLDTKAARPAKESVAA